MLYTLRRRNPKAGVSALSAEINSSLVEKTVSCMTISKLLRKKELNLFYAVRKPLLMLTNHQKQKKWCKVRLNYSMEQWKMIIFSDESNFKIINRKNKRFVCHKNIEKYLKQHMQSRIQKGGGSVGIWGCISMFNLQFLKSSSLYFQSIRRINYITEIFCFCNVSPSNHLFVIPLTQRS